MEASMDVAAESADGPTSYSRAARDLAELYTRHGPDLQRFAYVLTGDAELAEDLAQEAFVRLWANLLRVRDRAAHYAYLRRTVLNLVRGHARRSKIERSFLSTEVGVGRLRAGTTDPDIEEREVLWVQLLELPLRQRAAVVLRYYEDLTELQTAELMGCSQGAVKSLVARACRTLRKTIETEGGSENDAR